MEKLKRIESRDPEKEGLRGAKAAPKEVKLTQKIATVNIH